MTQGMANIRVVLVTRDPQVVEQVERVCHEHNAFTLVGTLARADEAASLARQRGAHVIVLDTAALQHMEQDVMNVALAAPDSTVFVLVPEGEWEAAQRALLAGARGFITKPIKTEEWAQTITRALTLDLLRHSREVETDERASRAHVIAIASPKGGVGRTFLAANLGTALHEVTNKTVLIMEAMSLPGDIQVYFSTLPKTSLVEAVRVAEDLSATTLGSLLTAYREGLYVLPGVMDYTEEPPDPDRVRLFLRLARQLFDYIVVDTGELQDPLTEIALKEADLVLLVLTPDLMALYRTSKFLAALLESKTIPEENIVPVLNMDNLPGSVRREVLERVLGRSFTHTIPLATEIVQEAMRRGEPVVLYAKRTPVSRHIYALAAELLQNTGSGSSSRAEATVPVTQALRSLWENLRSGSLSQARILG